MNRGIKPAASASATKKAAVPGSFGTAAFLRSGCKKTAAQETNPCSSINQHTGVRSDLDRYGVKALRKLALVSRNKEGKLCLSLGSKHIDLLNEL